MKNATTAVRNLKALLKKVGRVEPPELPGADDAVGVLVLSFLIWEASTDKATAAYRRVVDHVVDFNDLRVTMPHEIVECIGERYPAARDRTQRLRAALRDIYLREHDVTLEHLHKLGKREVKKYVESLDGMVPYVSARVLLLAFGSHGVPVDEQLRQELVEAGVADEDTDLEELSGWLARHVKAEDGVQTHHGLQQLADARGGRRRRSGGARKTRGAKKTTAKRGDAPARKKSGGSGDKKTGRKRTSRT